MQLMQVRLGLQVDAIQHNFPGGAGAKERFVSKVLFTMATVFF